MRNPWPPNPRAPALSALVIACLASQNRTIADTRNSFYSASRAGGGLVGWGHARVRRVSAAVFRRSRGTGRRPAVPRERHERTRRAKRTPGRGGHALLRARRGQPDQFPVRRHARRDRRGLRRRWPGPALVLGKP